MKTLPLAASLLAATLPLRGIASAQIGADPFSIFAEIAQTNGTQLVLAVSFRVPPNHYLYADESRVDSLSKEISLYERERPTPSVKYDEFQKKNVGVYERDFVLRFDVRPVPDGHFAVQVRYQGCSSSLCLFPTSTNIGFSLHGTPAPEPDRPEPTPVADFGTGRPPSWKSLASRFEVTGRAGGYVGTDDFLAFLDRTESGAGAEEELPRGLWISVLLFLLWGLGLNLTPCVLPMIPVNLAVIGAGATARSRGAGFAAGALYGAGMALAYGALGLVVVLSGSMFGNLNASPWFSATVAVLFVFLALAAFGLFNLDFSRFQGAAPTGALSRARNLVIPLLGAASALLAGACVAPAVIAVLTLSADLHARGHPVGLLLPFLLGIGMAIPWPLAGAGLAILPKPGRWMIYVKYAFGLLILAMAVQYAVTAYTGFRARSESSRSEITAAADLGAREDAWLTSLEAGMSRALSENKPVFIDFWAGWCKNCLAMEKTTFRDPRTQERLRPYVRIKYRMEKPGEPAERRIRDHFGFLGLPAYIVLRPALSP